MSFDNFLIQKKINAKAFQQSKPEQFEQWAELFVQLHPESFVAQKKFLLNSLRRKYALNSSEAL